MSKLQQIAHVVINDLIPDSSLTLGLITEVNYYITSFSPGKNATLFVKHDVNDSKYVKSTQAQLHQLEKPFVPVVIHFTARAFNYIMLILQVKRDTGLRVRFIASDDGDYIDLTNTIGNINRIISNVKCENDEYYSIDTNELHELHPNHWDNLVPCENPPQQGYDPFMLIVRLLILLSSLQRWTDQPMSQIDFATKQLEFESLELLVEYFKHYCLNFKQLQTAVQELDPGKDYDTPRNGLLLLGTILIRLHTQEQIDEFTLDKVHNCIISDGCPLNIISSVKLEDRTAKVSVNSLIRSMILNMFIQLKDFKEAHFERLLCMNHLSSSRTALNQRRIDYFQMFERISFMNDLFTQLPNYYKFNEVHYAQSFLSLLTNDGK